MKLTTLPILAACTAATITAWAKNPAVIVSVENIAPADSAFLTPVWVGFHNGQFDSYDGGRPADSLPIPGSDAFERLAEDGDTGPLTADFKTLVPHGTQGTISCGGPVLPLGPGQTAGQLFEVDPNEAQYFSYASMVLPSDDTVVANGDPLAHQIFNNEGQFVGTSFAVQGGHCAMKDAGTEVIDEAEALLQSQVNLARFNFTLIDKDAEVLFTAELMPAASEPAPPSVVALPCGRAFFFLDDAGESLIYFAFGCNLSGDLTAVQLHLDPVTSGDATILPMEVVFGRFAFGRIDAAQVVGRASSATEAVDKLVVGMAMGRTYINFHTAAHPAGEARGLLQINALN